MKTCQRIQHLGLWIKKCINIFITIKREMELNMVVKLYKILLLLNKYSTKIYGI